MFERLKIGFLRWLFTWLVPIKWRGQLAKGVRSQDVHIAVAGGQIGARVYTPESAAGPLPVILFFHGGGWVGGNVRTHDPLCRDLCVRSRHLVVSVDYRLAPEHPFPTAPQDCLSALDWLKAKGDSLGADLERLIVAGDSAGGNLAAIIAIQARERHPGLIKGQVLIYPVTDHYLADTASAREYADAPGLNRKTLAWLWALYLRGSVLEKATPVEHELLTPLRVKNLRELPPALVLLAECDPLRDEGLAYAEQLRQQGVAVQHSVYPGLRHGFFGVEGRTPGHEAAMAEITSWLAARSAQ
jgi:acetyl esterase